MGVMDVRSSASMSWGEYIGAESAPMLHSACRNRIGIVSSRNREAPKNTSVASATTAEIARQQADGSWKYVIDHPYAAEVSVPEA